MQILIVLLEHHGEVVTKRALFDAVWPGTFVEDSNLRVNVAALRKALGDGEGGVRLITSVSGRGYSFVGKIERVPRVATISELTVRGRRDTGALPPRPIQIVGRDEVVDQVVKELPKRGLFTLTGAGGIGKTAVALLVAERLAPAYRDGVFFIDLAPLDAAKVVPAHLASMMRLPSSDNGPLDSVVAYLSTQNLLLVMDNCEHVVDEASLIAERIRSTAPEVHVLATSREPLRAAGEWVQRLEPLAAPPDSTPLSAVAALEFPAVQMLRERVIARDASFEITDANASVVGELCARLDGLPLAIELASTQIPVLGINAVAARLDDRFAILTRGRRSALPRHQTLAATIDWSYETLTDEERIVFRRLAVFSGSFDLKAALPIGQAGVDEPINVVDVLGRLVEKSLVTVNTQAGDARYRMLESIRLYGFQKLLENQEAACVRGRHAEFCLHRCLESGDSWIDTPTERWLRERGGEIADIRAALTLAFSSEGDPVLALQLTAASASFLFKLLLVAELRSYLDRAVWLASELADVDDAVAMQLYIALSHCLFHTLGPVSEVSDALNKALELARRVADPSAQQQILWALFGNYSTKGDYVPMMDVVEQMHRLMTAYPDRPIAPLYHRVSALGHHLLGEHEKALRHAQQALRDAAAQRRTARDGVFIYDHRTATSSHYARILWMGGRPDQALNVIRSILHDVAAVDQPFALGYFLAFGAFPVSLWAGDIAGARTHVAMLMEIAAGTAFNVWQMAGRFYEQVLEYAEGEGAARQATRAGLLVDPGLTDFQIESLATYSAQLLRPDLLARVSSMPVSWATAEILRARGESLATEGDENQQLEAERFLLRSLEVARAQDALSWQLRTATSLARLWQVQGKTGEARRLLTDVFGRFTEGFATRDLIEARKTLSSLS